MNQAVCLSNACRWFRRLHKQIRAGDQAFQKGVIDRVRADGSYDVQLLADGKVEKGVGQTQIRLESSFDDEKFVEVSNISKCVKASLIRQISMTKIQLLSCCVLGCG